MHELTRREHEFSIVAAQTTMEDRMTLTHDRRSELLAACPLFKGIDATAARAPRCSTSKAAAAIQG